MKHPKFHNVVFSVCLSVSVALIVAGFIVPPTGVIDPSVLTASGILFAFAALSQLPFVIASGKGITLNHGSISVNGTATPQPVVNDDEDDDQDPC